MSEHDTVRYMVQVRDSTGNGWSTVFTAKYRAMAEADMDRRLAKAEPGEYDGRLRLAMERTSIEVLARVRKTHRV